MKTRILLCSLESEFSVILDVEQVLRSINQIFEAGIAVTAFSLFIRSLSFRLQDRVSRSFAVVLACVVVVFAGEAIGGALNAAGVLEVWLTIQWLGIIFLPAGLQHFSDALLETTGRPSRGRRKLVVWGSYLLSFGFVAALLLGYLLGPVEYESGVYPHPTATLLSGVFSVYYLFSAGLAGYGIWRAYRRTKLKASRRRITYLLVGAIFLAIGAYPYMLLGSSFAMELSWVFILLVILGNLGVFLCLLMSAYAVAFFGVAWPDRLVRSRLLKWVLRGPMTVFIMLFLITLTTKLIEFLGASYLVAIPIVSVISVLLVEHLITLVYPYIEKLLISNVEGDQIQLLQSLSDRMITSSDLKQFLEAILAGVCDQFQVSSGFIAAMDESGWEMVVSTDDLRQYQLDRMTDQDVILDPSVEAMEIFQWGQFWLLPLIGEAPDEILGMVGILKNENASFELSMTNAIGVLTERASQALEDRRLQRQIMISLEVLGPRVDLIQRLRAATRFDQSEVLRDIEDLVPQQDISQWVKEALSHYWGGPKLTENPLINLQVVQDNLTENEGVPANALRAILKSAMEQIRPDGDRKYTPEWTLYNILEMKFLEGRKAREVARRLAVSEADLYRKQRVAIETVANSIIEMEAKARGPNNNGDV